MLLSHQKLFSFLVQQTAENDASNQLASSFQNKIQTPDEIATLSTKYPMPNLKQMMPFKPVPRGTRE